MFQYLGVDGVEVCLLRAVGRTFRYGVASAYERAKGIQLTERTGRAIPVYDISQARLQGPELEGEDDPTIDQIRHVDPNEEVGSPLQDVQLWEVASTHSSEASVEGESTEDSTRLSAASINSGEVSGDGLPTELGLDSADEELAGVGNDQEWPGSRVPRTGWGLDRCLWG